MVMAAEVAVDLVAIVSASVDVTAAVVVAAAAVAVDDYMSSTIDNFLQEAPFLITDLYYTYSSSHTHITTISLTTQQ